MFKLALTTLAVLVLTVPAFAAPQVLRDCGAGGPPKAQPYYPVVNRPNDILPANPAPMPVSYPAAPEALGFDNPRPYQIGGKCEYSPLECRVMGLD